VNAHKVPWPGWVPPAGSCAPNPGQGTRGRDCGSVTEHDPSFGEGPGWNTSTLTREGTYFLSPPLIFCS